MHLRVLLLFLPLFLSCSIFDNEQGYIIDTDLIEGEWYLTYKTDSDPIFYRPELVDTAKADRVISFTIVGTSLCDLKGIKPIYNYGWRCEYSIYSDREDEYYLNFNYSYITSNLLEVDSGDLFQILELNEERILVRYIGSKLR